MSRRVPHGPCLGERVSALADGSMPPDAATRAMAHVVTCPACREALELERLTIERLRSLPAPAPSGDLLASLFGLGEPGGPVPLRPGRVPGTSRQPTTAITPSATRTTRSAPPVLPSPSAPSTASSPSGSARRGTRRPAGRRAAARRRGVTAVSALGMGVLALTAVSATMAARPVPGADPRARIDVSRGAQPQVAQLSPVPSGAGGTLLNASTQRSSLQPSSLQTSPSLQSMLSVPSALVVRSTPSSAWASWTPTMLPVPYGR